MHKSFSQLWTGNEYRWHARRSDVKQLVHAASNVFIERGVQKGDMLYVWSFLEGELFLIGRMEVGEIATSDRVEKLLHSSDFDHTILYHALARTCTPKKFGNRVPLQVIRRLGFISPNGGTKPPMFRENGTPDPQTFRGVRQITSASAALLDGLL